MEGKMIYAYINYPVPHMTIHKTPACGMIHREGYPTDRREVLINQRNVPQVLQAFSNNEYRFAAQRRFNGIWLKIDLGDQESEIATANRIFSILSAQYPPFKGKIPKIHC
jgi:hypothetical protein